MPNFTRAHAISLRCHDQPSYEFTHFSLPLLLLSLHNFLNSFRDGHAQRQTERKINEVKALPAKVLCKRHCRTLCQSNSILR